MIHVTIFENERQQCMGFRAAGHAGMAESGQDVVCAAASVLMINTMNAIECYTDDETSLVSDEEEGRIEFLFSERPTHDAELLLNAMILGLQEMANDNDYSEYIYVEFEEV